MKLGGFGLLEDYQKISAAGYDFAELDVAEIEALSEKDFETLKRSAEKCGFPILTGARLLPFAEPLFFTEGFSPETLVPYLEKACSRAGILGIKKVIIGNGKARSLLKLEDRERESVFIESLRLMAKIAGENGMELILEPLGPKYSNYIQTIPEAVALIQKVNMPNLFVMADIRHMYWSNESFEDLVEYVSYIHHVHIDYPVSYPERGYPSIEDDYDYSEFLHALKRSGYQDTLTVEADIPKDWNAAYKQVMRVLGNILL